MDNIASAFDLSAALPAIAATIAQDQVPALLSPPADCTIGDDVDIVVSFKECTFVSCDFGVTVFDFIFSVSTYPKNDGSSSGAVANSAGKTSFISRRVQVNNKSVAAEALQNEASKKTIYVESKQSKEKELTAKRMRELAGIPHKGNYV